MAGYWSMLDKQPGIGEIGSAFASAYLAGQQAKRAKQQQELDAQYRKAQMEHQQKQDELANKKTESDIRKQNEIRNANVQRFVSRGLESGSLDETSAQSILSQYGAMPQEWPQQQPQQPSFNSQIQAASSSVLGPEKNEDPISDSVSKRVTLGYGMNPGTPEFQKKYNELYEKSVKQKEGKESTAAADLRKEFMGNQIYKDTQAIASAVQKIRTASPTGAGDISMVFSFMKMVDPGSTVREGEFATAQNAGGVDSKIRSAWNGMLSGQKLSPELRTNFRAEAENLFTAQRQRFDSIGSEYERLAKQSGVAPGDVVLFPGFDGKKGTKTDTPEETRASVDEFDSEVDKLRLDGATIDDAIKKAFDNVKKKRAQKNAK